MSKEIVMAALLITLSTVLKIGSIVALCHTEIRTKTLHDKESIQHEILTKKRHTVQHFML